MKLPLQWLRELVDVELDTDAICERLTMAGLEVDGVEERGEGVRGVVVGRIVEARPHPNADRLRVCDVDSGEGEPSVVVCGAANARRGLKVAFARDGAELPGGQRIGNTTIRGVDSAGMLCSEAELGLAEQSDGILELEKNAPLGDDVAEHLGLRDTILEISITPNRGDCLSVLGLAREVALLTGRRLRRPRLRLKESGSPAAGAIAVRIDDPSGCRRYAARVVRGVRIGPSPLWLRLRLQAAGVRSINNVVDVTNYVMLERGQPLHAFDLARLPRPEIVVRRAGGTEALQTLDGVVRALLSDDLLITTGAEPVALAGVMGGADSEVGDRTTDLLLESAWFDPSSVRRTARRLDLSSEASYRFERGVDIEGVPAALDAAAAMIVEHAGGTIAPGMIDEYPGRADPTPIVLRPQRVGQILGCEVRATEVRKVVKALGATIAKGARGSLSVVPPSFRTDLEREIDLIEEVARVVGYDRIPARMPERPLQAADMPGRMALEREIRRMLRAAGFSELVGMAFVTAAANRLLPGVNVGHRPARLLNPIVKDEAELRTSLLQSVVAMWHHNRNHGQSAIAGFSFGKAYWWQGEEVEAGPGEGWRVAGVMAGEMPFAGLKARRPPEFSDAKGAIENILAHVGILERISWEPGTSWDSLHPGKSASIRLDEALVGVLGALHPDAEIALDVEGPHWLFEIDLDLLASVPAPDKRFAGLPRFPSVVRDLALVVDADFRSGEVCQFVREWNRDMVEAVQLFDEYVGAPIAPGKKSLAYSVAYRAQDRTLTDEEVNALQDQLMAALEKKFRVEHRQ